MRLLPFRCRFLIHLKYLNLLFRSLDSRSLSMETSLSVFILRRSSLRNTKHGNGHLLAVCRSRRFRQMQTRRVNEAFLEEMRECGRDKRMWTVNRRNGDAAGSLHF